jgi:hypothetical protein
MKLASVLVAGVAIAGLAAVSPQPAAAQSKKGASAQTCVDKGGKGTGSTIDDARFQAWEAVLQATDWGMWAAWMASGAKVKQAAAGYSVSNVREKCGNGGMMGKECIIRAKLCK